MILCFFFNDTATTEIYTLSLHDALPIFQRLALDRLLAREREQLAHQIGGARGGLADLVQALVGGIAHRMAVQDRKSTRLNSSHANISYAVFCLKKKKLHTQLYSRNCSLI